jgi:hypothetical protein
MFEFARNYLQDENRYDFHCVHGYMMIYLGSHGEVYLGCYAKDPIGNIHKNRLSEILKLKKSRELAEQMYVMDCPGCTNRYDVNIGAKHFLSHQINCGKKKNNKK